MLVFPLYRSSFSESSYFVYVKEIEILVDGNKGACASHDVIIIFPFYHPASFMCLPSDFYLCIIQDSVQM